MQEERARAIADLVMGLAAAGALYYVLKTPALRRVAWRLSVVALTATIPAWFKSEVSRAWEASRTA
jgi:hypothetical protein